MALPLETLAVTCQTLSVISRDAPIPTLTFKIMIADR